MNRDYVDEALDKAGELMSVIHQPAWQMMVKAFFEVDVVVDDKGVAHQRFDDQKDAVERATTGHGSKEATEYASYMWGEIALSLRDGEVYAVDPEIDLAHLTGLIVVGHPPLNESKRAHNKFTSVWCEPRPFIVRNHDIVDLTDWLLATPKGDEVVRSGTWATVRYARRIDHPVVIVYPDGSVER